MQNAEDIATCLEDTDMTKTTKTHLPSTAQVRSWWPNTRGEVIVQLMKGGLPYWRAVRRSRRYWMEGKYS